MVLTQLFILIPHQHLPHCFHPTMVLTQLALRPSLFRLKVSIPLWFSLNREVYSLVCTLGGFHPTMVLTQHGGDADALGGLKVSIPLWFSLNQQHF